MRGPADLQIAVDINSADPFAGAILEPGQPAREFSGWTAFATGMDEVVRRLGEAEAGRPPLGDTCV